MGAFFRAAVGAAALIVGLTACGCAESGQSVSVTETSRTIVRASTSGDAAAYPTIALPRAQAPLRTAPELRVMSFNVRVKTFLDMFGNSWDSRKYFLAGVVRQFNPDILGTQECLADQSDFLREQFYDYDFVGVGRDDGARSGEMCGIFFRSSKFSKIDSGSFWLSETPNVPGSRSWGSTFTRMVTWIKLRPQDGSAPLCVFNTHFDVWGTQARLQSSMLLRKQMQTIAGAMPCIITGDFNDTPGSAPYQTLLGGQLTDAYRATHPQIAAAEGTRHDFKGTDHGPRIDWIITNAAFQPVESKIVYTNQNGKFPSDHFPMTAVLRPVAGATIARVD